MIEEYEKILEMAKLQAKAKAKLQQKKKEEPLHIPQPAAWTMTEMELYQEIEGLRAQLSELIQKHGVSKDDPAVINITTHILKRIRKLNSISQN